MSSNLGIKNVTITAERYSELLDLYHNAKNLIKYKNDDPVFKNMVSFYEEELKSSINKINL